MDNSKPPRILFLNQMAGPLFRELAEDISRRWPTGELFTGHPDTLKIASDEFLRISPAPSYDRGSFIRRLWSWLRYLIRAFFKCLGTHRDTLLFLVQPPFLELTACFLKKIRRQHYVVLIYDIYPDTLINFGSLNASSLIARLWRLMNRTAWQEADIVFTIGSKMAEKLESMFDSSKTAAGNVVAIPNWASTNWIKPLTKDTNEFAKTYDQIGKLTVMYSGNLGQTHDIGTILKAAKALKSHDAIHFMIIGDGAKKNLVVQEKSAEDLTNLTVLGFQSETVLPYSLTTADIAVITLDKGSEGLSVPSKTYYAMASGAALIALCEKDCEVALTIAKHDCGFVIEPGDTDAMVKAILELHGDSDNLKRFKANSRTAAEKYYSRNNTQHYIEALMKCPAMAMRG